MDDEWNYGASWETTKNDVNESLHPKQFLESFFALVKAFQNLKHMKEMLYHFETLPSE